MYSRAARRGLNGSVCRASSEPLSASAAPPRTPSRLTDLRLRGRERAPVTWEPVASQRPFHSKSSDRSVADAVPVERKATFEKRQQPSPFDGVRERRAKAGKLIAGVAAASDSDMFKAPVCCLSQYIQISSDVVLTSHHRPLGNPHQSDGIVSFTYPFTP